MEAVAVAATTEEVGMAAVIILIGAILIGAILIGAILIGAGAAVTGAAGAAATVTAVAGVAVTGGAGVAVIGADGAAGTGTNRIKLRHRTHWLPVPRIQELARHTEASTLSVLVRA